MTKCVGCGIELQFLDKNKVGYTENVNDKLCKRCFRLANYGEYTNVSFDNNDYEKLLKNISNDSLIVYVCDILFLNLERIRDYNNMILVVTKRDVMPKSIKDDKIINYIMKYTSVKDVIIVSSKTNYNLDYLYNYIKRNSNNNEVYFIGDTNSGKSTLINKLVKNYGDGSNEVTVSMYPSTTLALVPIKLRDLCIIDTPGIVDYTNIVNYLNKADLKKVTSVKEIKPKSCQISDSGSLVIDDFVRIDYKTSTKNSIVIYGSNFLNIRFNSLKKNYLKDLHKYHFGFDGPMDVVIPGLCFLKISKAIELDVYVYEHVVPFFRKSLI